MGPKPLRLCPLVPSDCCQAGVVNLKLLPLSWEMRGEKSIVKQHLLVKLRDCYQCAEGDKSPREVGFSFFFLIRGVDFEW